MENQTAIKFQIEIAAQRIISQVMMNNEEMQKGLEDGIKKAVEEFDFLEFTKIATKKAIEDAIKSSASWGSIRDLARKKADQIVDEYIQKEMESFEVSLKKGTVMVDKDKK